MATLEVWVAVSGDGEHEAGIDANTALERLDPDPANGQRLIRLLITVPLPVVPTLTGEVGAESTGELTVMES